MISQIVHIHRGSRKPSLYNDLHQMWISIRNKIKDEKSKKLSSFYNVVNKINELSFLEIQELNQNLDFKNKKTNPLNKWLQDTDENNYTFIFFILQSKNIVLNINQSDSAEQTPFLALFANIKIPSKHYICKLFF